MHIQDGFLTGRWAIGWYGVAIAFVTKGVRDVTHKSKQNMMFKPLLGLVSAAVFFISLLPIPVPYLAAAGTSSHATGTPLAAILLGPFASIIIAVVALLLQALLFSHGGITTLGANTFSMGIVGSLMGYGVFKLLRKAGLSIGKSACSAAFLGDLAVYCTTSVQLALGAPGIDKMPFFKAVGMFIALFMPSQLPIAVLEGLITGGLISYIAKVRPDILFNLGLIRREEQEDIFHAV